MRCKNRACSCAREKNKAACRAGQQICKNSGSSCVLGDFNVGLDFNAKQKRTMARGVARNPKKVRSRLLCIKLFAPKFHHILFRSCVLAILGIWINPWKKVASVCTIAE